MRRPARDGWLATVSALALASLAATAAAAPVNPAMRSTGGLEEPAEPVTHVGRDGEADAESEPEPSSGPDLPASGLPGTLELHRPNYVLPLTWTEDADGTDDVELKFQISLKHRLGDFPVYLAYTQTAYFRWMDEDDSRPFRETNYNPEVWYRVRPGRVYRMDWLGVDVGYEHESNGEDVPASRSWDRIYVRPWLEHGQWLGALKLWYRIPEDPGDGPGDPKGDDNPDILDFYGHHELKLGYTFDDGDWAELTTRYSFSDERGAVRLRYATPVRSSYFYVELFSGYGESLETFKENRDRIGIGFALLR